MQNLVSKNPIQRFKQGKKIVKAEEGAVARWQRRIRHPFQSYQNLDRKLDINRMDPFRYLENKINKIGSWIGNNLVVENYTPENGGTTNNRLKNQQQNNQNITKQNTYKTPKLKGSKEAYLNRLKQQGFTSKPTKPVVKSVPVVKKQSIVPRSGWSYGYNRSNEISDIKATQQMLKDAGYLSSDKYNVVDGKWGSDTENAYKQYLAQKQIQEPTTQQITDYVTNQVNKNNPIIETNVPSTIYNQIYSATNGFKQTSILTSTPTIISMPKQYEEMLKGKYKQGGQLVSRNPINRFKSKKK